MAHVRFHDRLPSEEILRAELVRQVGSSAGLEEFEVRGDVIRITTAFDPVTIVYAEKALHDLGGEVVDFSGNAIRSRLPEYARKPWPEWPWWKRAGIHARFAIAFLLKVRPQPKSR
jgi:hypothetical protein